MLGCTNANCGSPPCTTHVIRKGKVVENADSTVSQDEWSAHTAAESLTAVVTTTTSQVAGELAKNLIRVCETLKAKTPPETG